MEAHGKVNSQFVDKDKDKDKDEDAADAKATAKAAARRNPLLRRFSPW